MRLALNQDRLSFIQTAQPGERIPLFAEVLADLDTPVSAFLKLPHHPYGMLLESVEGGEQVARYSFLCTAPAAVITARGEQLTIQRTGQPEEHRTAPLGVGILHFIEDELKTRRYRPHPALPRFCGGAVAALGYDLVRGFESLGPGAPDDLDLPDAVVLLVDDLVVFDHVKHTMRFVANTAVTDNPGADYDAAESRIHAMAEAMRKPLTLPTQKQLSAPASAELRSAMTHDQFCQAVQQCKDYIAAGDVIQVVLSQRFQRSCDLPPFELYRALRSVNPSPYMFYLALGERQLVGSSPEALVTVEGSTVRTRPIAGTRPRGATPEQDRLLEQDLLADEKEKAEHLMLVDLGRNDLGRVSAYGTVQVDAFQVIERYSHVMHLVSSVTGQLAPMRTAYDALRACFPAGTVSGAPKVRAMEIIDELEPTRRGFYAGAVGYFGYSGDMDACITIRTMLLQHGQAYVQAGAGIVADSVPENEYQETHNKARALFRAIDLAETGLL